MKLVISTYLLLALNLNLTAQIYTSNVQFESRLDGFTGYSYHPITILLSKDKTVLKIINANYPNNPLLYTIEKVNAQELESKQGFVTQYKITGDDNFFPATYDRVLVNECYETNKIDDQHSYKHIFIMIRRNLNGEVEEFIKYFSNTK